jgi:hypothetical protein
MTPALLATGPLVLSDLEDLAMNQDRDGGRVALEAILEEVATDPPEFTTASAMLGDGGTVYIDDPDTFFAKLYAEPRDGGQRVMDPHQDA